MGLANEYVFRPEERPTFPGSPFVPAHTLKQRLGYGAVGLLVGTTATFGNETASGWQTATFIAGEITTNARIDYESIVRQAVKENHAKGGTVVVMEPQTDGWWGEIGERGTRTQWGKVLTWAPPARLLLAWQINAQWQYDPGLITELELRFTTAGHNTLVTLEHRNLERFGESAAEMAPRLQPNVSARMGRKTP